MSLTFGDVPAGAALFLDANTLVYAHSLHPQFGPPSSPTPEATRAAGKIPDRS